MLGTASLTDVGFSPQGLEFAQIAQRVAGETAQILPGLVSSLLWSHPQIRQQTMQYANTLPLGYGMQNLSGAAFPPFQPQLGPTQFAFNRQPALDPGPQAYFGAIGQPQNDIGQIAQQVAWTAAQALPAMINNSLASQLQSRQQTAQSGGSWPQAYGVQGNLGVLGISPVQPQNIGQLVQHALAQQLRQQTAQFGSPFPQYGAQTGFGYGLGPFQQQELPQLVQQAVAQQLRSQTMQFGGVPMQGIGMQGTVNPQQLEINQLAQQISGLVAQHIPSVINGALSTIVGSRL